MNISKLDKAGLLGDKEDVFFEKKKVPLYGFEVGFDARVAVPTGQHDMYLAQPKASDPPAYLWKLPEPMIFLFARARKTPDTTSKVGSS
jgi:hypothetical protein